MSGVVIAGGGLAAQRCAETLRDCGYEGRIRMVCGEPERPYDRPPLSKGLLAGDAESGDVSFRQPDWYLDNDVELAIGRRAVGLDPPRRALTLDDGSELVYDDLLIATGSAPRSLPVLAHFTNAFPLRTLMDAERARGHLRPGARLAVIGAGFIGQEVAATAAGLGAEVTVIEALETPLAHILGPSVGRWMAHLHAEHGVRLRLGAQVEEACGNGAVEELTLAGGERISCDVAIVGVGVAPATSWLAGSGLPVDGVPTDEMGRTAIPHVFAAGDASRPFDPLLRTHVRTEHWDAAARQGQAAARAMLGLASRPPALPSFWSDQYGLRMQYVGYAADADRHRIEGSPGDCDFHVIYTRGDDPVAAFTVERPRALAALRRELEQGYTRKDG
jgi:NADPH-dependent 2,4-dienoyl-CoA reductase/sulfur reductase-like enzyme